MYFAYENPLCSIRMEYIKGMVCKRFNIQRMLQKCINVDYPVIP